MGEGDGFRISGITLTFVGFFLLFGGIIFTIYGFRVHEHESEKPAYLQEPGPLAAADRIIQGGVAAIFVGALLLIAGPVSNAHGKALATEAFERQHRIMPESPDETIVARPLLTRASSGYFWVVLGFSGMLLAAAVGSLLFALDPTGSFAADDRPPGPGGGKVQPPLQDETQNPHLSGLVQDGQAYHEAAGAASFTLQNVVDRIFINITWTKSADPLKPGGVEQLRARIVHVQDGRETQLVVLQGLSPLSYNTTASQSALLLGTAVIRVELQPVEDGPVEQPVAVNLRAWNDV